MKEIAQPVPGTGEVLVKVRSVGICGSDLPRVLQAVCPVYPTILGHEFCGVVEQVGQGVTSVAVGDSVAGIPLVPCFACDACNAGLFGQCKNFLFLGTKLPGAMAEYLVTKERNLFPLRPEVTAHQGAMFEPATVALHAILEMGFVPDNSALVLGCGTIGLMAIQCLKALGADTVVAVDIGEKQLEKARLLGADQCVNAADEQGLNALRQQGITQIIECAGVPSTVRLSLKLAGPRGKIIWVGIPHSDVVLTPSDFDFISKKELRMMGALMSYSAPFPGIEWGMVERFFSEGRLQVNSIIEDTISLEQVPDLFVQLNEGRRLSGKIIVDL